MVNAGDPPLDDSPGIENPVERDYNRRALEARQRIRRRRHNSRSFAEAADDGEESHEAPSRPSTGGKAREQT